MAPILSKHQRAKKILRGFIQYLLDEKTIDKKGLTRVVKFRSQVDTRMGMLAALKGYLTIQDAFNIVANQLDGSEKFGELALSRGIMTQEQVDDLLTLQKDPFRLFLECIAMTGIIGEDDLRNRVRRFTEQVVAKKLDIDSQATEQAREAASALEERRVPISKKQLQSSLRKVKQLATLPGAVKNALNLLEDPESRIEDVTKALMTDQVLCAHILRLVNSAFFSARQRISSISQAVVTLGFNAVKQVVLSTLVIERFKDIKPEIAERIWWHTILTSQWAKAIAKLLGHREQLEEALIAGLIHDVGRPVLIKEYPDGMIELDKLTRDGVPISQAEESVFGMTHAEVGAFLCHFWNFPASLTQAVRYHHDPIPILRTLRGIEPNTKIVAAACTISDLVPQEDQVEELGQIDDEFQEFFGLRAGTLVGLVPQIYANAGHIGAALM